VDGQEGFTAAEAKELQKKLPPKQQRFVEEYLVDLNAAQAAIRSGYSARNAKQIGSNLLGKPRVSLAIRYARALRSERTEISQDRVIKELARIAFGGPRSVMKWGKSGVELKASDELTEDEAAIVQEVSETQGERTTTLRLKTCDKVKALELLGRHLGMFKDKVEHSGTVGPPEIKLIINGTQAAQ
jgi:phage terminase small subunit